MISSFKSSKIILVPLTELDSVSIYELYSDPIVLKSYEEAPIPDRSLTNKFISEITSGDNFVWTIRPLTNDVNVIGNCALHDWNKVENSIEVGGALLPNYHGQGIMVEAFECLTNFAKLHLNVSTFISKTLNQNIQAIKMMKKSGFLISHYEGNNIVFKKPV